MTVIDRLLGSFQDQAPLVVCECRHCGTSVDEATFACPECGSGDIVRYEI